MNTRLEQMEVIASFIKDIEYLRKAESLLTDVWIFGEIQNKEILHKVENFFESNNYAG